MSYEKKPNRPSGRDDRGRPPTGRPTPPGGGFFIWILVFGILLAAVYALVQQNKKSRREEIPLSLLLERIRAGEVAEIDIRQNLVIGKYRKPVPKGKEEFSTQIHESEIAPLSKACDDYNKENEPKIRLVHKPNNELIQVLLWQLLPILLIVFFLWFFLARQFRSAGGTGSVLSFGKSRARRHTKEKTNVTFDQVAGIEEAKEDVQEVVEFLKSPGKFRRLGGRIPRGTLLVGPPGCGKTLLAKAIAGEADVPFFSISGSDFIEMFVGVGASRVRDLFRQAKENSPCIIFLDEIDAVGRRRAIDLHGASAEGAQTLNAILVEMDGFETDDAVIVISATNRPDVLDPALLRPGRFDRQIVVNLPDMRGREAILRVHARKYKLGSDVDLKVLARGTPSFSGADLEALMNEGTLIATRKGKNAVEMIDLEEARDKVRWGRERRSLKMSEEDRRQTAYHEGGHALVAKLLEDATPLHKVSIIPQGMALGMTMALPERDRYTYQRKELKAELCVLLAGRAAEEMFGQDITTGAQNDLDRATDMARSMVCRWGMSDEIGPVSYHEIEEPQFLGNQPLRTRNISEATLLKIDEEIAKLMTEARDHAKRLLQEHRDHIEAMVENLLKYEVLYAKDVDAILAGRPVEREPEPTTGRNGEPEMNAGETDGEPESA